MSEKDEEVGTLIEEKSLDDVDEVDDEEDDDSTEDDEEEEDDSDDEDLNEGNGEAEEGEEEESEDGDDNDESDDDGSEEEDEEAAAESSDDENCDRCPICLNRLRNQDVGTPESCDHIFCLECIQEWAKVTNTCPVDRQVFRLILARHALEEKIFRQFSVEDNKQDNDAEEEDPTYCEVCGQSDREDRLLLCDGCDLGYHCECLDPPLSNVPVQEWFCPDCHDRRVDATVEEPNLLGRQIARTRISERVRRIIAEARAERADRRRRVAEMITLQEAQEDEEPIPRASTSRSTPRTPRKRKTTRRKRTTKKRKTRKRTTKKRKTTKGKKRKTKRKTKGKRRAKKGKRTKTSSSSTSPAFARTAGSSTSVKSRIADKLGLSSPPVGRTIPLQKVSSGTRQDGFGRSTAELGAAGFSILGNKDELYIFADQEGEERQIVHRPAIPADTLLSKSAKSSRLPLNFSLSKSKKVVVSEAPVASIISTSVTTFDLLGSIMQNQDLLHKGSKHVTINRDGSLSAAVSNISPVKKSPIAGVSISSESLLTSNAKPSVSNHSLASPLAADLSRNNYLSPKKFRQENKQSFTAALEAEFQKAASSDDELINCQVDQMKGVGVNISQDLPSNSMEQVHGLSNGTRLKSVEAGLSECGSIHNDSGDNSVDHSSLATDKNSICEVTEQEAVATGLPDGQESNGNIQKMGSIVDHCGNGFFCETEEKLASHKRDKEEGEASDTDNEGGDVEQLNEDQEEGEIVDEDEDLLKNKKVGLEAVPAAIVEKCERPNKVLLPTPEALEVKKIQEKLDLNGENTEDYTDVSISRPFSIASFINNMKSSLLNEGQETKAKIDEEEEVKKEKEPEKEDKSSHMISILDFIGNESAKKFGLPEIQEAKPWERRAPGTFRSQPDGSFNYRGGFRGRRQDNWSSRWRSQDGGDGEMDSGQDFNNRRRFPNSRPYYKGPEGRIMKFGPPVPFEARRRSDSQDSRSSKFYEERDRIGRKDSKDSRSSSPRRKDKRQRSVDYEDDEDDDDEGSKKPGHEKSKKRSKWAKEDAQSSDEKEDGSSEDEKMEEKKTVGANPPVQASTEVSPAYPPPPPIPAPPPYHVPPYVPPQTPLPPTMHYGQLHPQTVHPGQTPYTHPAYPPPNGHPYPHSMVPAHLNPRHPYPGPIHPSYSAYYGHPHPGVARLPSHPPAVLGSHPTAPPHPSYIAPTAPATRASVPAPPAGHMPVNNRLPNSFTNHTLPQLAGNPYARPPYPPRPPPISTHLATATHVPVYTTSAASASYASHQQLTSHPATSGVPRYTQPPTATARSEIHTPPLPPAPSRPQTTARLSSHPRSPQRSSSHTSGHSKRESSGHSRSDGHRLKTTEETPKERRPASYCISPPKPTIKGVTTFDKVDSSILLNEVKKGFRQLVEDAVRCALKSAWSSKKISKDEYKDIFKRAVEKVCGSNETVVHQEKIQSLVTAYVVKARKARTSS